MYNDYKNPFTCSCIHSGLETGRLLPFLLGTVMLSVLSQECAGSHGVNESIMTQLGCMTYSGST